MLPKGYPKISIFIPAEYKCIVIKSSGQAAKINNNNNNSDMSKSKEKGRLNPHTFCS